MPSFIAFFKPIYAPSSNDDIAIFYFFWMLAFIAINIVWDIFTDKTPDFHITRMPDKTGVVYNAATFCSSSLLLLAMFQPDARKLAGDVFVPFALAGFSGVAQSIAAICPYSITALKK